MSSNFTYIDPKNRLKREIKQTLLIKKIVERAKCIPDIINLRHDTEFLKFVCCIIENEVNNSKKKNKIDKKNIVFEVFKELFGKIGSDDLIEIGKNIEYLIENNQIVKIGKIKKVFKVMFNWIKSKLF